MFIFSGRFARIDSLPVFTPIKAPNGKCAAVMKNINIWTYVLYSDGSTENIFRETVVEVLASSYDVVAAGLKQLEREISEKSKHEASRV